MRVAPLKVFVKPTILENQRFTILKKNKEELLKFYRDADQPNL